MLLTYFNWALCNPCRGKWWLWTGSVIRLIAFFITPRCSICVPSRPIASTVFRLLAVTPHKKLKVVSHHLQTHVLSYYVFRTQCEEPWSTAGPPYAPERFDRVLLDAPCSGLGQRPTMGTTWSLKEIRSYQPLQRKLLQAVSVNTNHHQQRAATFSPKTLGDFEFWFAICVCKSTQSSNFNPIIDFI